MKAWKVYVNGDFYSGIFFAETRGKAIYQAMQTDVIDTEDCSFTEIRAIRLKEADKYYAGLPWLDWSDEEDKLILIRDFGYHCYYDDYDENQCNSCIGKEYCDFYKDRMEEKNIQNKSFVQ